MSSTKAQPAKPPKPRGFASPSYPKDRQSAICSKGGKAAHAKGRAHELTSEEASRAAAIGHKKGTAHEFTPEEAKIAAAKADSPERKNAGSCSRRPPKSLYH